MKHIVELRGHNQAIMFNWNITNGCNYNCSYCATPIVNSNYWMYEKQKLVVARLKTVKQPFRICVAGGEPTLHRQLYDILHDLHSCDMLEELILNTNLSRSARYFKQFDATTFPKLLLLASYHPEYHVRDNSKKYIAKCKEIHDAGINFKAVIMVSDDRQYWKQTYDCLTELSAHGVRYHMTTIDPTPTYKPKYDEELYKFYEPFFATQPVVCDVTYDDGTVADCKLVDVMIPALDKFHGFNCKAKIYRIDRDGLTITHECTGEQLPFALTNEVFDRIITCPLQQCREDIRLYYDKWK